MEREEVTFDSGRDSCAAWLYRPTGTADRVPCVVMAHGFSLTRHDGLPFYAEPLAEAGLAVLVFDHRYLGDSGGEPRQHFRKLDQLDDWRAAVAFARRIEGIDPDRIVLWGYSFAGGHAVTLAAAPTEGVVASLVLCPFVNGLRRVMSTPPSTGARILPKAIADMAGRHARVAVTGPPSSRAAMSLPGEAGGFERARGEGSPWRNEIGPGVFLTVAFHRPLARASRIKHPLWVGLGERDITVHGGSVEKLAKRAPRGELHRYDVDHFDPFTPQDAARIVADQVEFLARNGLTAP